MIVLFYFLFIPDDVHIDGKDNDYAFRHILPVRADAHQVQSVVHDSDDQGANQGSAKGSGSCLLYTSRCV